MKKRQPDELNETTTVKLTGCSAWSVDSERGVDSSAGDRKRTNNDQQETETERARHVEVSDE